ncbi:DUF2254 domain-containing protein [Jiella marina]|uniref:DUF2254 domain-containing protein n=1 Tax=Jiella sp. LLJ827 TaxID=2917712 RepID=UPI002101C06A|nr:DUF2254 domain-containing protein [Jiella sp. LLJ827]MCQ0990249.1 DUF2254 domain-containing protein [Jiella sp. LLJ827]
MRALLIQYYERIKASYWFLPSVLALLSAILAFTLVEIDTLVEPDWLGSGPFLYATQPEGARTLLGAIGGSMIGVAGTVFSVTMAAVVFASGSYGPRLLTNFMNDRGNQVTLAVFVATFVYCMIVLRTVRDGSENGDFAAMFVPNIAIFGALVLAILSIGVLIYFIHHVPSKIHISNVIADIGHTLLKRIGKEYPEKPAHDDEALNDLRWQLPPALRKTPDLGEGGSDTPGYRRILSDRVGYVQIVDAESLIEATSTEDVVVRLTCRPGNFIHVGQVIALAWPAERVNDETCDKLRSTIAVGNTRSPGQDLNFLFDELVEIAGRALSPGVNDPYTAITCLDWLKAAMAKIAGRSERSPYIIDDNGKLRAVSLLDDFPAYLEIGFGHLRQYAASDMIAGQHFLNCLTEIVPMCRDRQQCEAIREQAEKFLDLAREELSGASLATLEAAGAKTIRAASR